MAKTIQTEEPRFQSSPLRLAIYTLLVGLTAWAGIFFTRGAEQISAIWLPSGILLGIMLCTSRKSWPAYLIAGFIANATARLIAGIETPIAISISLLSVLESLVAALLLIRSAHVQPDLSRKANFYKFVLLAVLLTPALSAVVAAILRLWLTDSSFFSILTHWFVAHSLGMAIITPVTISFISGDILPLFRKETLRSTIICLLGITFTAGLVFYQTRYPFLFFIPPVVIAIAANMGLSMVVLIMPILTLLALVATIAGHGPFALAVSTSIHEKVFLAQVFVLINFLMALYVANSSAERRLTAQLLEEEHFKLKQSERLLLNSEARFRMLSENSADMVFRLNQEGIIGYVSPSVKENLGWTPEEMVGHNAIKFTHAEDVHLRQGLIKRLEDNNEMVTDRIRGVHKNGDVVWLERRTRRIESDGKVFFLSNLSNITNQKKAEDLLNEANKKLSLLATVDALTGLYNRRKLDEAMAAEWRRVERKGDPLSFLLLDVDRFKLYNDNYGHQGGDQCLQTLGKCLATFARRPSDIAARYGGEELALLLPECDEASARAIAESVRQAIEALQLPHIGNGDCGGVVTVSIGVATCYPAHKDRNLDETALIKRADELLYEAKRTGRNRVMSASTIVKEPATAMDIAAEEQRLIQVADYADRAARCKDDLDRIAQLAAALLGAPIGLVTLVGRDTQLLIGKFGLDIESTSRDVSFCAHTMGGTAPMIIKDAHTDSRFAQNPIVTGGLGVRFYAGAPLISADRSAALGAVCVIDRVAKHKFSPDQAKILEALSLLVTKCLESHGLTEVQLNS